MRWNSVGTKIGLGFGMALAIFTAVGIIAYQSASETIATSQLRTHTHEVISRIVLVQSLLTDMQSAQRGFTITGDPSYLDPYTEASRKLDAAMADLGRLTLDNAVQQRRINDSLKGLVSKRISLVEEAIAVARTNSFEAGQTLARTGKGKENMDEIRNLLSDMKGHEEDLLADRVKAAERSAADTRNAIRLGTAGAIFLAALAGIVITRNIAGPLRDLTEAANRITAGDLRTALPDSGRTDEVGVLEKAFSRMNHSLTAMAVTAEQIADGDLRATVTPQSPDDRLGNAFARMTQSLRDQTRQLVEGAQVLGSAASEIVASMPLASSAQDAICVE